MGSRAARSGHFQPGLFEFGPREAELYHSAEIGGYFTINVRPHFPENDRQAGRHLELIGGGGQKKKKPSGPPMKQHVFHNKQFGLAMEWIARNIQYQHTYISQNSFSKENRQSINLLSISAAWVDLDFYSAHDDKADDGQVHPFVLMEPEQRAQRILEHCDAQGIPLPSVIMHSGRGVYVKWFFTEALPKAARPRWDALMKHLTKRFEWAGADPRASLVSQILRVNGTRNLKSRWYGETYVHLLWAQTDGGGIARIAFDRLCDAILPFSRDAVKEWKQRRRERDDGDDGKDRTVVPIRSAPRARRPSKIDKGFSESAKEIAALELWWARLEQIRMLVRIRYGDHGVPEGERDEFVWISINALAYVTPPTQPLQLWHDALALVRELAPSYSAQEVAASASSVLRRFRRQGPDGLYRMRTSTLCERLRITPEEAAQIGLGTGGRRRPRNDGAMGFERMANLTYDEYVAEMHRRQAAGGKYGPAQRAARNEGKRASARLLHAQGYTVREIAYELGVSKDTVSRWCR